MWHRFTPAQKFWNCTFLIFLIENGNKKVLNFDWESPFETNSSDYVQTNSSNYVQKNSSDYVQTNSSDYVQTNSSDYVQKNSSDYVQTSIQFVS